jgi:hypothetical protein
MIGRTMYQPLVEYLAIQSEREVTLSFVEIEAIIGMPLSVSASGMPGVWHDTRNLHVRRWRAMGWRARYDRRNQCVHFARDAEAETLWP